MYSDPISASVGFELEENHHRGAASVLGLLSIVWIIVYGAWVNTAFEDFPCCVLVVNGSVEDLGFCGLSPGVSKKNGYTDVSAEFKTICVFGCLLYALLLAVAIGHCIKSLRRFSHIFGGVTLFAISLLFIVSNFVRFGTAGRYCSLDSYSTRPSVGY